MESQQLKIVTDVIGALLDTKAIKATVFISAKQIVRAKRTTYKGKIEKGNIEITLTIGKPNFSERELIAKFKKAREKLPIDKMMLKFLPVKK